MKVIFNADDFGLTHGVNQGIKEAHTQGVVNSTTLMVGMDADKEAVEMAKQLPDLKVGIHLRFTAGKPLTGSPNLQGDDGLFPKQPDFWSRRDFDAEAIEKEVRAQLEYFDQLGLELSHIDSHHHAHGHPQILPIVENIAKERGVPLRAQTVEKCRYQFTEKFFDKTVELDALLTLVSSYQDRCDVLEVMCHPAHVDEHLKQISSYALQREKELSVLTDPRLKASLKDMGIQVSDYSAVL
ncbi:putative Cellobiose phosphotransferase system YdjC-like protein [Vibrio nigripulchritudo SO65]|uniref:chitin disaccharide deacetylase n=1 Tax=Vibrio nigripulchritudo TaxID=28173 RepID=UPI0003B1D3F3|nr:chitin disaccharide deacetylase [Vibrio nigripulchritudo]CCN37379.1 putative Cellobiose phosphotransferase system YdjC-like protein [Vibrio nigripulchritudo AM115]CCN42222.1 putative Cellobiose phosphotransferase system YdjC-like protein [Vibrio nigripulchritudo FTn2]CCN65119.1 putative Cellobiose phosphotransferase system YdjC-like protein [Vibrio nigripulchritudo POn4]CCN75862.1 putative Cellobiose phosphotransferase system YdjC-like protein [Vibrio nigripulchritudo SO65]